MICGSLVVCSPLSYLLVVLAFPEIEGGTTKISANYNEKVFRLLVILYFSYLLFRL